MLKWTSEIFHAYWSPPAEQPRNSQMAVADDAGCSFVFRQPSGFRESCWSTPSTTPFWGLMNARFWGSVLQKAKQQSVTILCARQVEPPSAPFAPGKAGHSGKEGSNNTGLLLAPIPKDFGDSNNQGSQYRSPNSRALIARTTKKGPPNFWKLPFRPLTALQRPEGLLLCGSLQDGPDAA